jgi:hypothetical protein
MAKNTSRQNKNPVTSEVRQNAPRELWFFFSPFGEGWGCLISFVPKVFLWSSHCVPTMLPEFKSSNSSSFYPISFALSFILVTYISSPKEEIITYLFWGFQKLDFFHDGPMRDAYQTRKN